VLNQHKQVPLTTQEKPDVLKSLKSFPYHQLRALARPERNTLLLGVLFLCIGSGAEMLFPQWIGRVIDALGETGKSDTISSIAVGLIIIFFIQSVAVALRYYCFVLSGERIVARLRELLYKKLIEQEVAFFDQRRTGELLNRLSSDAGVLQSAVSSNISLALRNTVTVVGGLTMLLITSVKLTLLMLSTVPAVMFGAVYVSRKVRKLSKEVQDALAKSSEIAEETFAGLRTVRAFSQEPIESKRYAESIWKAFGLSRKRIKTSSLFSAAVAFASYASIAGVLWYGSYLVTQKEMSIGDLSTFILYTFFVAFSLASLSELWSDLMRTVGASERIFEIIDREPEIPIQGGIQLKSIEGEITFDGVDFYYPTRPEVAVLQRVNLTISPGEIVALVGPSGSGKSTIASLLLRFYDPIQGQILLDKTQLPLLDPSWLRKQIGIVSQEPILFSTSIAQNIRYGKEDATEEEIIAAAKVANADTFIQKFPEGYETQVGERGVQLSGGQKQRIAIARAVLKNPKILVLDEATSALDAESEHLVKEALDRLMKNRTTLIIAHRLSTVKDADRVLVLSDGKLVQEGTHQGLLQEGGLYKKLVQMQLTEAV
jgi:ABC transporter fused permease/ATP-binding protein